MYYKGELATTKALPIPEKFRIARGFTVTSFTHEGEGMTLTCPSIPAHTTEARLRITSAFEDYNERTIAVRARSGPPLGTFDVRFATTFQPFEAVIAHPNLSVYLREGVLLTQTSERDCVGNTVSAMTPLWLFDTTTLDAPLLVPHVVVDEGRDALSSALSVTTSMSALQPFGWMAGCVLEGQRMLARIAPDVIAPSFNEYLSYFFNDEIATYEGWRNTPMDGAIEGVEGTLPFAALAAHTSDHPMIDRVLSFWDAHKDSEGCAIDGYTTAEGNYTVAYPMAVIAVATGRDALVDDAMRQIRIRMKRLATDDALWLRYANGHGRTFRNWTRGVAWYYFGIAKTLEAIGIENAPSDIVSEFVRFSGWLAPFQREDGLFAGYLHMKEIAADASGTAGIAAAFAKGAAWGVLPDVFTGYARCAYDALLTLVCPDGVMGGVSQNNKGGERVQKSDYRVLFQMANGLFADLACAVDEGGVRTVLLRNDLVSVL